MLGEGREPKAEKVKEFPLIREPNHKKWKELDMQYDYSYHRFNASFGCLIMVDFNLNYSIGSSFFCFSDLLISILPLLKRPFWPYKKLKLKLLHLPIKVDYLRMDSYIINRCGSDGDHKKVIFV